MCFREDASLRSGRVQSFTAALGEETHSSKGQFEMAVTVRLSRRPGLLFMSGVLAYMCLQTNFVLGPG